MFPTKQTISLFIEMCNRDGIVNTVSQFLNNDKDLSDKYIPTISFLKSNIKIIENQNTDVCPESFAVGFLTCFHLFRLQLEAESMEIEDMQISLENLNSYVSYLEERLMETTDDTKGNDT